MNPKTIGIDDLAEFMVEAFSLSGVPAKDAQLVAITFSKPN
jgi:hypothetical protein